MFLDKLKLVIPASVRSVIKTKIDALTQFYEANRIKLSPILNIFINFWCRYFSFKQYYQIVLIVKKLFYSKKKSKLFSSHIITAASYFLMWVGRPHNVAQYTPVYKLDVYYNIFVGESTRSKRRQLQRQIGARPLRDVIICAPVCACTAHTAVRLRPPRPATPRRPAPLDMALPRCEAMPLPCRRLFGLHNAIESLRSTRLVADRTFPTSTSERRLNSIAPTSITS